ncbi:MAG: hypothetical protein KAV99_04820 [Candidatus Latescibacteria bacterium]|nr:hypothetical protein [Candidatus Latescibacterota bacterium]
MAYQEKYDQDLAPKIGVVANSIQAFSKKAKEVTEGQFINLFEQLKKEGVISQDSIYYPKRIFGPHEAYEVAKLFGQEQVEVVVILDSAFPNGHVLSTIGTYPYLVKIPVIVTASPEVNLGMPEWVSNAWCGVIMNNYAAKQIGRYLYPLAGFPDEEEYQDELKMLLNVFHAVAQMRKEFLGRFGEAPGGFHSASGDQLVYAEKFGTKVETIDLTAVMNTYKTAIATGYRGRVTFSDKEVEETLTEMQQGRIILVEESYLEKAARLYHSLRAIIKANGFTSIAFRCWPEMNEAYIDITPCLAMTWLLAKGDVSAASCESDWPTAVAQSLGTYLSGKPAACLDFVNYVGGSEIVQLGHCGVGIAGYMAPNDEVLLKEISNNGGKISEDLKERILAGKARVNDALAEHSVLRQVGVKIGPVHIGQFQYGKKTGINLIRDRSGKFKMLVFVGENSKDTAKGMLYSAADVKVKNYRRLNQLILEHGFSHHLAMAFGDISRELRILCEYYGIEYISPDQD